jgi:hypothetical protein
MLSRWSVVDVDSNLGLVNLVNVDNIADISEVHAVFVFRVEYVDPADGGNHVSSKRDNIVHIYRIYIKIFLII